MTNPLGITVTVGMTDFVPTDRTLFLCHPVRDEQGQLIDLQVQLTNPLSTDPAESCVNLSEWIGPQTDGALLTFWKALENGRSCSINCRLATEKPASLLISPFYKGFLIEVKEVVPNAQPVRLLSSSEAQLPDGLPPTHIPAVPSDAPPAESPTIQGPPVARSAPYTASPAFEKNELLEAILNNTSVGLALYQPVWQQDRIHDFTCLVTNAACATITGHSIEKIKANSLTTLFPKASGRGWLQRMSEVAYTGVPLQYQKHVNGDGFNMWGQFMISRVGDNVLFTVTDITKLKRAKALLDKKNSRLKKRILARTEEIRKLSTLQNAILKHAGQAIISTDINGVIQTANQASEKLIGYSPAELIGLSPRQLPTDNNNAIPIISYQPFVQSKNYDSYVQRRLEEQGYLNQECFAVHKNGQHIPILMTSSVLQNEAGKTIGFMGIASDISALKRVEAELKQKNQEFNTFFDGALDMHCISDSQGSISTVNGAFLTTLGYTEDELKAIPFLYLIHIDEQKFVYQELLSKILQQPVRNQVNRMKRKDGSYRTIEWNAIAIDQVVYGSARDITARQESDLQLRNLNHRLQLATQAAGQGIWEDDLVANRLIWDKRMWEIYGLEPRTDNWNFGEFINIIHPDDLPAFHEKSRITLEGTGSTLSQVYRIIRPDGTIRYIENNGRIIRDQQGRPERLIGVGWDVTKRKLDEEALRESEQRFREIAENVDEIFWIHSTNPFRLLYVNPAYERIFNACAEQLYRQPRSFIDAIVDEDKRAVLTLISQYRSGQEGHLDCRLKSTNDTVRWLSIRTFIIRNEAGQVVRHIAIANDVTSQKEKEFVLRNSLQREQELNQLKSQFVSTASHEFRTPLTTIQSSVDLIRLYQDKPSVSARQSVHNHLGVIQKEIEKFSHLLTDMLTIGKIEAGKIAFTPRPTDVLSLCTNLIATHFSARPDGRTVQLLVEGIPCNVSIDDKLMGHVLVNLLSNAFKFSTDTSPTLRIAFRENDLFIQVIDTGMGIPAAELPALFQAFFRASNTAGIPGTGLGLVIARQFIELHHGHLDVQSAENKGTTFSILLPTDGCG
jgi:PAS domain S-box-containing protein